MYLTVNGQLAVQLIKLKVEKKNCADKIHYYVEQNQRTNQIDFPGSKRPLGHSLGVIIRITGGLNGKSSGKRIVP